MSYLKIKQAGYGDIIMLRKEDYTEVNQKAAIFNNAATILIRNENLQKFINQLENCL